MGAKRIELPSHELAEELRKHLEKSGPEGVSYSMAGSSVDVAEETPSPQWSGVREAVAAWSKGKRLEMSESIKLKGRPLIPQFTPSKDVTKKLDSMTPDQAEARFTYLQEKPFSELSDAEYEERLALADSLSKKKKK